MTRSAAETDLARFDAAKAERLWADGFRPLHAHDLRHGQRVLCVETWFGLPATPSHAAEVLEVSTDRYGSIIVRHTGGTIDVDPCDEVWVYDPSRQETELTVTATAIAALEPGAR